MLSNIARDPLHEANACFRARTPVASPMGVHQSVPGWQTGPPMQRKIVTFQPLFCGHAAGREIPGFHGSGSLGHPTSAESLASNARREYTLKPTARVEATRLRLATIALMRDVVGQSCTCKHQLISRMLVASSLLPLPRLTPTQPRACLCLSRPDHNMSSAQTVFCLPLWACAPATWWVTAMPPSTRHTFMTHAQHAGRNSSRLLTISRSLSTVAGPSIIPFLHAKTGVTTCQRLVSTWSTLPCALLSLPLLRDALLWWPRCMLHSPATFLPARPSNRRA
jgi:hypothetical protein